MYFAISLGFGMIAVVFAILGIVLSVEERRFKQRLDAMIATPGPVDTELIDTYLDRQHRTYFGRLLQPLVSPVKAFAPAGMRKAVRLKLSSGGMLRHMGELEFIGLRAISMTAGVICGLVVHRLLATDNLRNALLGAGVTLVLGMLGPDYWLQGKINGRQNQIRKMLPDASDLMVVSMEAGTGFDAALQKVAEKFPDPISEEFDRVIQEMKLGKTRAMALRDMADRCGVNELGTFVSSVIQADQLGSSMAKVLRVQADTLRSRRLYRIREQAQKLPVKILFPMILFIFPALFVVLVGPAAINIYEKFILM